MRLTVKILSDARLAEIYNMTTLNGSIPASVGLELLGHAEAIKTEAAIKIFQAKEMAK